MKDIAFHITDITENSIRAGASEIKIAIVIRGSRLELTISDNGCGMSPETLEKAINPFYTTRTTRKVGLGLSFLIQNSEQSGGSVDIKSEVGKGTVVYAYFQLDNIDCPPVGDLAGTLMLIITGNPSVNTVFSIEKDGNGFGISTEEIKEIMDGVPIGHPEVSTLVKEVLEGNIGEIAPGLD